MLNPKMDQLNCMNSNQTEMSIENIIFIDFQYSCWTSPTVDLHYFLNTSLQESLRPSRFDDLIMFYHSHLERYLNRLGYKKSIPNLDQLKQQYHDKNFYGKNDFESCLAHDTLNSKPFFKLGFIVSCMIQPMMINDRMEKGNCETLISKDDHAKHFKRTMFAAPTIQENLKKLIPIYDEMGVID